MKKLCSFFCIFFGFLSAADFSGYGYLNFGIGSPLPIPVPVVGGGYRMQQKQHGVDFNASCVIVAPERPSVKCSACYLYYLTPKQNWYVGVGPQITEVFDLKMKWQGAGASPEFLIGKETGSKRFWEVGVDYPLFFKKENIYKWDPSDRYAFPYVFAQYGWGF